MKRATFHTEQLRKIVVATRVDWAANPWVWVLTFRRVGDRGSFNGTERPIIFSARMVNALLANAKTQTRRLNRLPNAAPDSVEFCGMVGNVAAFAGAGSPVLCPFGAVGERLWVREGVRRNLLAKSKPTAHFIADGTATNIDRWRWKNKALPAIHMPREVCRIVLEITEIRCERLHSITEADAKAEGAAHRIAPGGDLAGVFEGAGPIGYRNHFRDLWTEIHGEAP